MAMIDPVDWEAMREVMTCAGAKALTYFRKTVPHLKTNQTYVTDADLAVQDYLNRELSGLRRDFGIIGEEEDLRREPSEGSSYWVVDPIDGTGSFVAGLPVWGIAVAVVAELVPQAGYFYMPVTGDFFSVSPARPVERNGERTALKSEVSLHSRSIVLVPSKAHRQLAFDPAYPGRTRSLGSTAAHAAYTACASADAAVIDHVHIWDFAAGMAMILRNGGCLLRLSGAEFSLTDALLAGAPLDEFIVAGSRPAAEACCRVIKMRA